VGTSSRKREMNALKKENRIESDFLGKRENCGIVLD
jgi:hypothetical protein